MAFSPSSKTRFSFITFFSLSFLCFLFFFSKKLLQPSIFLYTDLLSHNKPSHPSISFAPPLQDQISPTPNEITPDLDPTVKNTSSDVNLVTQKILASEKENLEKSCNLYSGKWVKDNEYPLYGTGSCPFIDEAYSCRENGRKDTEYMKWRWKPWDCELPRFNATDFLERLRGKRLMLVGDSMNRNQFESMLCLLHEALPDKSRMFEIHGYKITKGRGYFIFKFMDYNCTVEFRRSHFLVKEGTRLNREGKTRPTLLIDEIDKSASRWMHADILVFNTGHWWTHGKTARGKDYFQEGGVIYPQFDAVEAFKRAMRTWGRWIDENMNHEKLVFYRGYATAHFSGGDWDSGGTCNGETEPITSGSFLDSYPNKMRIVEDVIREMQFPVILLNVTRLTNFRKDAHPSIYGSVPKGGKSRKQDCSHWCLPGVPDAWNELIYTSLVMDMHH
ncbi:protein trichome birefringence-like protein 5 [Cinnamomum micranthum f. kanehirae]|uniref:Protein trichome birefringence-like protein 5 n=1 Tax=Cinnamomum micranthum f. kanehirae TaxID=337451 RepID=A0A3S3MKA1_9MAGN|nr:protein trichome birefringence-like protein 5 [Cinnamomum micranthum f. kanehirae]